MTQQAISNGLCANAHIKPIAHARQVSGISKLADGGMRVTQRDGNVFDVADETLQAFLIYTVLNSECNVGVAA